MTLLNEAPPSPIAISALNGIKHEAGKSKCCHVKSDGTKCGNAAVKGTSSCHIASHVSGSNSGIQNSQKPVTIEAIAALLDERIMPLQQEMAVVKLLIGKVTLLEEENTALKQRMQQTEEHIKKQDALLAEASGVCASMRNDIANLQKAVQQGASAELGSKIVALRKELSDLRDSMKSMAAPMETDGVAAAELKGEIAAMQATVAELKARPASYAAAVGGQVGWTTVPSRSVNSGGMSADLLQFTLSGVEVAEGLRGGQLGQMLVETIGQRLGVTVQIANARILPQGKTAPADSRRRRERFGLR